MNVRRRRRRSVKGGGGIFPSKVAIQGQLSLQPGSVGHRSHTKGVSLVELIGVAVHGVYIDTFESYNDEESISSSFGIYHYVDSKLEVYPSCKYR